MKDLIWKRDVSEVTGYGVFFFSKHAHGPIGAFATGELKHESRCSYCLPRSRQDRAWDQRDGEDMF